MCLSPEQLWGAEPELSACTDLWGPGEPSWPQCPVCLAGSWSQESELKPLKAQAAVGQAGRCRLWGMDILSPEWVSPVMGRRPE